MIMQKNLTDVRTSYLNELMIFVVFCVKCVINNVKLTAEILSIVHHSPCHQSTSPTQAIPQHSGSYVDVQKQAVL